MSSAPCGTYAAYQQHKLSGETACELCLQANRDYKNAHQREYERRPENRQKRMDRWLKSRYGMTPADLADLLARQGGVCAICRTPEPGGQGKWHIDHDHACCPGKTRSCGTCVRGLLCVRCNMALGLFHDSLHRLRNAIRYLSGEQIF